MTITEKPAFHVLAASIGRATFTKIPGWPSNDLEGLFDALQRWTLCPRCEGADDPEHPHARFSKPFRCLAWGHCISERIPAFNFSKVRYIGTQPIHADHPEAVSYSGNFLEYSFGFRVDTDDPALIEKLDVLIAANMATPAYQAAKQQIAGTRLKRSA